ncbi:hypothetical protein GCM10007880_58040 [Mesorhizobium amorphae]|nr:hypothetical protein GCM10007880_58040 [Mesorhizobium amorphae]
MIVERVDRAHRYLYLVESVPRGPPAHNQGARAQGCASDELDRLAASIAWHSERSLIVSDIDAGSISARRIGGPLLFGRV